MKYRKTKAILEDIKSLIYSKGYIYALCMVIYDDFHILLQEIHEVNFRTRLSKNEVSLLIGFLIKKDIDFSFPRDFQTIITFKKKTYDLLNELHLSLRAPVYEKLIIATERESDEIDFRSKMKDSYNKDSMFTEPIFYANDGVYDFQFLDFLDKKYRYDLTWLLEHRSFDINETKLIMQRIKDVHKEKSQKVNFYSLKEKMPEFIEELEEKYPLEEWEESIDELTPLLEFYQYANLFDSPENDSNVEFNSKSEESWKSFYENLIDLFVVKRDNFEDIENIDSFLNNFSFRINKDNLNSNFKVIGDFNLFNALPILELDDERFFIPITFSLYEACYESPYYWMLQDKSYKNKLAENRGNAGEEISYEFLSSVFGIENTYKSVKIVTKKGKDDTDIDVLCILGSKALCVQVKAKKLTELSKKGNSSQLQHDFKGAVQDAYKQGIISRSKILAQGSKFYSEEGILIELSEDIDEVYIMGVTSENYPSLTHQAHILLEKAKDQPYPLFLTVFDLEVLTHYLNDPYDLLYYVRQRITLMDYFQAESEMVFLGYHLVNKLWKLPNSDLVLIDSDYGGIIDRNYYPFRLGVDITDEGDAIKTRWKNKEFLLLCDHIKTSTEPKITDVIFTLLDLDGDTRDNVMKYISQIKGQTLLSNKSRNFSILSNNDNGIKCGVTYISWKNNNLEELQERLVLFCKAKKYSCKGDVWVGFGSLKDSSKIIDTLIFNNHAWHFDKELEEVSNILFKGKFQGTVSKVDKNIGRNDKCFCESGLKYKKCCGRASRHPHGSAK